MPAYQGGEMIPFLAAGLTIERNRLRSLVFGRGPRGEGDEAVLLAVLAETDAALEAEGGLHGS